MKKKLLVIISSILLTFVLIISSIGKTYANDLDIDGVLNGENYCSLSPVVKQFIKNYYEENGVVLLTKDLAKDGDAYLNPGYIKYLESEDKDGYYVIPSVTAYKPVFNKVELNIFKGVIRATKTDDLPTSYDLRNVNGKNFVTPSKNQGTEGLCWAYATMSLVETHDLIAKNKSYDSTATILSEKQIDYGTASNGIIGGNKIFSIPRILSDGGALDHPEMLMLERLGAYSNTWDNENASAISTNQQLEPNVVFDRDKALFEVDGSVMISDINSDPTNTNSINEMVLALKRIVYDNGGATVNIRTSDYNLIHNILNGNDYITITNETYYTMPSTQHALHIIGWDDNYQYGFCSGDNGGTNGKFVSDSALYNNNNCGQYSVSGTIKNYTKVTGKGAWILKNSWGNHYSIVYLPYDSFIDGIYSISQYSSKNWDNSSALKGKAIYDFSNRNWRYVYSLDTNMLDGDTAVKLKIKSNEPKTINLYFSENGTASGMEYIGNYTFDYAGVKTIDLQSFNLKVKKESVFQIDDSSNRLLLFTTKGDNTVKAYTDDITYVIDSNNLTSENTYNISVTTKLKNVNDNEVITYKIKKENGDYLPTTAYTIVANKAYYNMATPIIKLKSQYSVGGNYTLETWKSSSLLYTSSLVIDGDGSTNTNTYVLTLDYNYNNLIDDSHTVTTNTPYGTLPTLTRDGYTFLGWYTSKTGGTKVESTTIFTGTSDTTIYAHWQLNGGVTTYIVTFKDGNIILSTQEVVSNGKATKPSNPTKTGYTFKEWQLNGQTYDFNTPVTSNITLTATWNINKYTVTFKDGNTTLSTQTVSYNGKATKPTNPTKTGYTFKEWQLNGQTYDFNTPVTSNITLTATWNINKYTVTFKDGNTTLSTQTVSYNGKATKPTNPTKTGYTFKEWQLNGQAYDFNTPVTSNITLTAIWNINKYTVTFNSNGGTSIPSQTVSYNGKATKPTNPTKTGYTFKEWQLNSKTYDFNTPVTSNITLVALWQKNNGIITTTTLKEDLTKKGYIIIGDYVTNFILGESIASIKSKLGNEIIIESKTDIISTGTIIKKGSEKYTVYIKGDLNGDGKINSADLLLMRKHLLEESILTGPYKQAGIIESTNDIKSLDLLRLRQYLLGEYTFK